MKALGFFLSVVKPAEQMNAQTMLPPETFPPHADNIGPKPDEVKRLARSRTVDRASTSAGAGAAWDRRPTGLASRRTC